jgi:hypothetical protein
MSPDQVPRAAAPAARRRAGLILVGRQMVLTAAALVPGAAATARA